MRFPKFIKILDVSKFDSLLEVLLETSSRQEKASMESLLDAEDVRLQTEDSLESTMRDVEAESKRKSKRRTQTGTIVY